MPSSILAPTVCANGGSGEAWSNVNNAKVSDNTYATLVHAGPADTQYLENGVFGFAIPDTATINGIEVLVEGKHATDVSASTRCQLVKEGVLDGSQKALLWSSAEAVRTYGGASDLWGTTWTPAEINAGGFGCGIFRVAGAGSQTVSVDQVRIRVTYTEQVVHSAAAVLPTTLTHAATAVKVNSGSASIAGALALAAASSVLYAGEAALATSLNATPLPLLTHGAAASVALELTVAADAQVGAILGAASLNLSLLVSPLGGLALGAEIEIPMRLSVSALAVTEKLGAAALALAFTLAAEATNIHIVRGQRPPAGLAYGTMLPPAGLGRMR